MLKALLFQLPNYGLRQLLLVGIAILIALFSFFITKAQAPNFRYFTTENGLPQNYIYDISQDGNGFLWLSSGDGIACYNGKEFKTYSTENGLENNFVTASQSDENGDLWIGYYQGGIARYDQLKDTFLTAVTPEIIPSRINQIVKGTQNDLWIVSQSSGIFHRFSSGEIKQIKGSEKYLIYGFTLASESTLLLGTSDGLLKATLSENQLLILDKIEQITTEKITFIRKNKFSESYFIGSEGSGFFEYYLDGSFKNFNTENGLISNNLQDLYQLSEHKLVIATKGKGIFIIQNYDAKKPEFNIKQYTKKTGLSDNRIEVLFQDKESNLWLGSYGGGLMQFLGEKFSFHKQKLTSQKVHSVLKTENKLWAGTSKGLFVKETPSDVTSEFKAIFPKILASQNISTLAEDTQKNIWIGTAENGIYIFNTLRKSLRHLGKKEGFEGRLIKQIISGENSNELWIATTLNGVVHYKNGKFQRYSTVEGFSHNNIYNLFKDSKNRIWVIAHASELGYFENGNYQKFANSQELKNIDFNCVTEDELGNFWFGSNGKGVFKYRNGKVNNYSTTEGLLSNYIYTICTDNKNNIWCGTKNGLSKIYTNPIQNSLLEDTLFHEKRQEVIIYKYGEKEGLKQLDVFPNGFFCEHLAAVIWFGTNQGILKYNADEDFFNQLSPTTKITKFTVFDQVKEMTSNIKLKYDTYRIRFDFLGLSLKESELVKYQYKLEGYDYEWSEITEKTYVKYPKLEDGNYIFKVRAANSDGVWNEKPTTFSFQILRPIWKETWFWVMLAAVFMVSVYTYNRIKIRSLKQQKRQLEHKVKERTKELSEEKQKLESANIVLDDQKQEIATAYSQLLRLEDFKNAMMGMIVHDLKNPLNAVIALSDENPTVKQSGKKMLNMVLNILDIQKFEDAAIQPDLKVKNINDIVEEAISQIILLVEEKELQLQKVIGSQLSVLCDEELTVRVIVNILTNAIKYTPAGGEINIIASVETEKGKKRVRIAISDSGSGIPKNLQEKVFEKFGQVEAQDSGSVKSTGLGLTFCKMVTEAHGGIIGVNSELGEGSTFFFTLERANNTKNTTETSENTEKTTLYASEKIKLSITEKDYLQPFIRKFQEIDIYETSRNLDVLTKIELSSKGIQSWKTALKNAIYSFHEERYKELLKL